MVVCLFVVRLGNTIFPLLLRGEKVSENFSNDHPVLSHQWRGFKGGMSIASLNVNGIRSHIDEIKLLMCTLEVHIMALNETKIDPGYPCELTAIAGYHEERLERSARGSGVSIYVRDSIRFNRRMDVPIEDLELIFIEISPQKCNSVVVLAWYRPPSDPIWTFEKLETVLLFLDTKGKDIILLGGTNCDLTKVITNQPIENHARHMSEVYNLFSFKQLIQEPTRVSLTTSSLIDHIATTCPTNNVDSGVLQVSMSDHYLVYCRRKLNGAHEKEEITK